MLAIYKLIESDSKLQLIPFNQSSLSYATQYTHLKQLRNIPGHSQQFNPKRILALHYK